VQALYSGVENQSAITYGNHFENGYLGRPGSDMRFDFIIVHESAHEWFGNSITARDRSDMWIHEGWANYSEGLFVQYMWGKADAIAYVNAGKDKVTNQRPVISEEGVFSTPPVDQYKKGALFLNTLRSVVDDDAAWFALLHDYYQHFKYQTIMTTDMVKYFNQQTGRDLTVLFDEYLRHAAIPVLELAFDEQAHTVGYRWRAEEPKFDMPVRVGRRDAWQVIHPTTANWQTLATPLSKDEFEVATDLYYIDVSKQ
jgi:aminopeptidase N